MQNGGRLALSPLLNSPPPAALGILLEDFAMLIFLATLWLGVVVEIVS